MASAIAFAAGLLVGVVGTLLARSWQRVLGALRGTRPALLVAVGVVAFATCAAILYFGVVARTGKPGMARSEQHANGSATAQSMQQAVAGLEARLARDGGTDADWELLARAYDFLGRPDDASRARAHRSGGVTDLAGAAATPESLASLLQAGASLGDRSTGGAAPATAPAAAPTPTATLEELTARTRARPADAAGWLALAEAARARGDNRTARTALEKVIALKGMTAQSWADYADVLASLGGNSLGGPAGAAIDQALALEPANPKALWLKASQAHEQRRFADALVWWRKLRAALPADSPDTRIIDANIAEDSGLLGQPAAAEAVAGVSGTVSIDGRLAARVQPDAALFIYAKAADSPGPPLAVLRTTAAAWPVSFRLDDSMAMLPSRRLSQFDRVVVEARISRSGQAQPGSGDLYVKSAVVKPGSATRLALVIDRELE
jgi:cytochrome c-type biogenesis protein CcmH